ncbi:phage gp6-like head-tail connector protein [Halomonas sp. ISL-60]|uniref:head-tail connector protein n=1 Tax=Halomonas sp. ISL-56 TaxID=2819149 RepID=UPI001BED393F|nr:head-tail connector protein [Halomonas sp. ISL-56]MBT2771317.1 phage gp6-like head-tail connector protein [Halomonas sp. ISL-60]MBT2800674.1 phage gp6-like head-tail connector protein [Halomonas sp. ISL-56]
MELKYITLEQLKHHIIVDHNLDDMIITLHACAAEQILENYVTESVYQDDEETIVKPNFIAAIAVYSAILYRNRDETDLNNKNSRGLPQAVTSLISNLRSPTVV